MSKAIRVMWLGLRGFPDVQGGVETHAEQICPRLAQLGCDVHVIVRKGYQPATVGDTWHGVHFHRLWAPRSKGLEAIIHTFWGVCYAAWKRPDILHIQAIGPAIMTPLARMFGLKVVITHHGPDYDRQKWGGFAKRILQLGERLGVRWANARIVISQVIRQLVQDKYGADSVLIPNGVRLAPLAVQTNHVTALGLTPGRYILLVSRLVPEKRHLDLIAAFQQAQLDGWQLAIVGASDHPDDYTHTVLAAAQSTPGVLCTGFQRGEALAQLYTHAGLFVLPSSHEGLPIALLEALSYGLPVVASDIPANLEVGLPPEQYFPLSDTASLSRKLIEFSRQPLELTARENLRQWVAQRYDWGMIAQQILAVYQQN